MKKTLFGTSAAWVVAAVVLAGGACSNADTSDAETENHQAHSDDHAVQHGEDSHMQHMEAVRNQLKKELGDDYEKPVSLGDATAIARGQAIYNGSCSTCHGAEGKGDGPAALGLPSAPADFTDAEHASYYSDAGRLHIIKNGIPNTLMVGWSGAFGEQDINDVFTYVTSLKQGGATSDGHAHGSEHDAHGSDSGTDDSHDDHHQH